MRLCDSLLNPPIPCNMLQLTSDEVYYIASLLDFDLLELLALAVRCDQRFQHIYRVIGQVPVTLHMRQLPNSRMFRAAQWCRHLVLEIWNDLDEGIVQEFIGRHIDRVVSINQYGELTWNQKWALYVKEYEIIHNVNSVRTLQDICFFENLQRLRLRLGYPDASLPRLDLPHLREVSVEGLWRRYYPEIFLGPKVSLFEFDGREGGPKSVPKFMTADFPSLKRLVLRKMDAEPQFAQETSLASFPCLGVLEWKFNVPDINDILPLLGMALEVINCDQPVEKYPHGIKYIQNSVYNVPEWPPGLLSVSTSWCHNLPNSIQKLHLLDGVPDEFEPPSQLAELQLSGSFNFKLLNACHNVQTLCFKGLSRPTTSKVSLDFAGMPNLRKLSITSYAFNELNIPPPVEEITLDMCRLLEVAIPKLVIRLKIKNIKFTKAPFDHTYCNLRELEVFRCGLELAEVPVQVVKLNVRGNMLTEIPVGESHTALEELDISMNPLMGPQVTVDVPNLKVLRLPLNQQIDTLVVPRSLKNLVKPSSTTTVAFVGEPVIKRCISLLPNEFFSMSDDDQAYRYHPETTEVMLDLGASWNPTLLTFPPLELAHVRFRDNFPLLKFETIFTGLSIRYLTLFMFHRPTKEYPLGIPSLVEWLGLHLWADSGDVTVGLKCLEPNPRLKELVITSGRSQQPVPWSFVDESQPKIKYVNGTKLY